MEFNPVKANQVLDAAGWRRGADGVRAREGRKLKYVFQTSTNAPRQKIQQIVKQACQKSGIDLELKSVAPAVFFSSDEANPDTDGKFFADLQMYNLGQGTPDPYFIMNSFCSWEIASKANKWQGRNRARWRSDEYDRTFRAAEVELDPVKRAALLVRLNDLVCGDHAVLPIIARSKLTAMSNKLQAPISGWTGESGRIFDWYKTG
jgi:peptide/nickel transport system substrate-binding protein